MAEVRIILQARLNSTRLPGKVLLPVAGYPLLVLAALRAGNTGLPVVVATSSEAGDDPIAATAERHGLAVFRGSLEDVMARFTGATADLDDDDWVVRTTADNVVPDGKFIEGLLAAARAADVAYMGTHSPFDGLPYGLSAEVFSVRALRAVQDQLDTYDREHVTPAIKRRFGSHLYHPDIRESLGHLRCTIDTFGDYERVNRIFAAVDKPLSESWQLLCQRLGALPEAPRFRIPFENKAGKVLGKITLGTAQLGLPQYGRTNTIGRPPMTEVNAMIRTAVQHGITHIDCARAYGAAEQRVGDALKKSGLDPILITKLSPLSGLSAEATQSDISAHVEASVYRSLHDLRRSRLDVLMLHRWSHRQAGNTGIWKTLLRLRSEGLITDLGASVSHPAEAVEALADPDIKHLQIPFNLLDHRWRDAEFLQARRARPDVTLYGRSVFLQGILLAAPASWPAGEGYSPAHVCQKLDQLVEELGRQDRADLCLAFAAGNQEIDTIVMGMESLEQLLDNLTRVTLKPLTGDQRAYVRAQLPEVPGWLLNPAEWPEK